MGSCYFLCLSFLSFLILSCRWYHCDVELQTARAQTRERGEGGGREGRERKRGGEEREGEGGERKRQEGREREEEEGEEKRVKKEREVWKGGEGETGEGRERGRGGMEGRREKILILMSSKHVNWFSP